MGQFEVKMDKTQGQKFDIWMCEMRLGDCQECSDGNFRATIQLIAKWPDGKMKVVVTSDIKAETSDGIRDLVKDRIDNWRQYLVCVSEDGTLSTWPPPKKEDT